MCISHHCLKSFRRCCCYRLCKEISSRIEARRFDAIILVILSESDAMKLFPLIGSLGIVDYHVALYSRNPFRHRGIYLILVLIRKEGSGVLSALLSSLE